MSDPQTLAVYADRAEDYAAIREERAQRDAIAGFLARLAPQARILDLGCGPGLHAAQMQAQGFHVTAMDPCEAFVDAAKARGITAILGGAADLTADASYDAVWASFSLLHLPKAEMPDALSAVARALVPEGWFYLGLKMGEGEARDAIGRYYSYYTEAELIALLAAAGFGVVACQTGETKGLAGTKDPFILLTARKHA